MLCIRTLLLSHRHHLLHFRCLLINILRLLLPSYVVILVIIIIVMLFNYHYLIGISRPRIRLSTVFPWINHLHAKTAFDLILDTVVKSGHTTGRCK